MISTRGNQATKYKATSSDSSTKTPLSTHLSLSQWKKRQTWSTKSTLERQSKRMLGKVTCSGYTQGEDVRCTTLSSSTRDLTTKWSRRCSSVMKYSKITANLQFFHKGTTDQRSSLDTRWNCRQLHTSNTKRWTRTAIRTRNRISRRAQRGRFSLLRTKKGRSQWDSKVSPAECKPRLTRRRRSKTAEFREMTTSLIREDLWLGWSIQPPQAPTKSKAASLTKARWWTKRRRNPSRISRLRNLSLPRTPADSSSSKRKCSLLAMTS